MMPPEFAESAIEVVGHPDIDPATLTMGSNKRVLWRCLTDSAHPDFEANVNNRAKVANPRECPKCSYATRARKKATTSRDRSIAVLHKDIADEFLENLTRSGIGPDQLSPVSNQLCRWLCSTCQKPWEATVDERTRTARGAGIGLICPTLSCRGQVPAAEEAPRLVAEFIRCLDESGQTLATISSGSNARCLWRCPNGHEDYEASVKNRVKNGSGCNDCGRERTRAAMRRPAEGQSLADVCPRLEKEYVRNLTKPGRGPEQLTPASGDMCMWRCNSVRGHREWPARVYSRSGNGRRGGTGCPQCARWGKARLQFEVAELLMAATGIVVDVEVQRPVVKGRRPRVDLYIPSIGLWIDLDPAWTHSGTANYERDVRKNRAMENADYIRVREAGLVPLPRSIVLDPPSPAPPWAFARALAPELERRGLTWRILNNSDQAAARGRAADRWNQLPDTKPRPSALDEAPHLAKEYVANETTPGCGLDFLTPGSNDKCRWKCTSCNGEWVTQVRLRVRRGAGCAACSAIERGRKRSIAEPGKSLRDIRPEIAAQFIECVDDPELTAETIGPESTKVCRWRCDCDSEWESTPNARRGSGCPTCGTKANRRAITMAKPGRAFKDRYPDIADQFIVCLDAPDRTPADLGPKSDLLCQWACPVCERPWEASVLERTRAIKRPGCPDCSTTGHGNARKGESLAESRPDLGAEFVRNLDRPAFTPGHLSRGSSDRVLWRCSDSECGHIWDTMVRSRGVNGSGCPQCAIRRRRK